MGGEEGIVSFILSFLFVILIIVSAFLQASDNALKKIICPGLTACCGLLVLYGAVSGTAPLLQGVGHLLEAFTLAYKLPRPGDQGFPSLT